MLQFHLKACSKCHGDLALDEGDWLCLQCGTYYYTRLYRTPVPLPAQMPGDESRIGDGNGDRQVKAALLLTTAVQGLSRSPDLSRAAFGLGETAAIGFDAMGPGALGVAAGTGNDYRSQAI